MVCVFDQKEAWEGEVWQVPVLEGRVDIRPGLDGAPSWKILSDTGGASGHEIRDD